MWLDFFADVTREEIERGSDPYRVSLDRDCSLTSEYMVESTSSRDKEAGGSGMSCVHAANARLQGRGRTWQHSPRAFSSAVQTSAPLRRRAGGAPSTSMSGSARGFVSEGAARRQAQQEKW